MTDTDPSLARLRVYPIKSLDGCSVRRATFGADGGFVRDRQLALVGPDGEYVNGKRTAAIHRIRADYDLDERTVTLSVPDVDESNADGDSDVELPAGSAPDPATIGLSNTERLAAWFSDYFGYEVSIRDHQPSYPDDTTASGPTVVSTPTLQTVADWFGLSVESVRRRFRANVEIGGCEPFWEDRFYGDRSEHVAVAVGDATLHGEGPCRRCVVPTRDPDTGVPTPSFTERFVRHRRETLPDWSDGERFDGAFRLAVNTVVPTETVGSAVAVGDSVGIDGSVPVE